MQCYNYIMNTYFSQQGEDIYIYYNFINKITPDGIFVELGAMNGITYSNTKFFEDTLKFTGTLIEPTKQYDELILNRPKCKCYNIAVNYNKEKVKFIGCHATAGMTCTMHDTFRTRLHSHSNEYYVDGEPISEIFEKSDIKYIDLMTIDVEGGEQVVLETINFNIPIYIICIELDGCNKEKDEKCRQILTQNGFTFDKQFCINEFWVNNNYYRKSLLYDSSIIPCRTFSSIRELGHFPFIEKHVISDVENALRS